MKLIYKHGNIDQKHTRAYKIACPNCGCEFYAAGHDFKWRERSIDGKAGIVCPDCNIEIVFKPSNCIIDMREDPDCGVFDKDTVKQDIVVDPELMTVSNILNLLECFNRTGDNDYAIKLIKQRFKHITGGEE